MKLLAMHITNQKLSFDIFTVGNLHLRGTRSLHNIPLIFGIKEKSIILTHTVYCWLLPQIYPCNLRQFFCSRVTFVGWLVTFISIPCLSSPFKEHEKIFLRSVSRPPALLSPHWSLLPWRFLQHSTKAAMQLEIQVALNFIISYLYNKLPRRRVNIFGEELERQLKKKYEGHWYPRQAIQRIRV